MKKKKQIESYFFRFHTQGENISKYMLNKKNENQFQMYVSH